MTEAKELNGRPRPSEREIHLSPKELRHPEAARFHQRGEGSRVERHSPFLILARSLRRLKRADVRDDAGFPKAAC